MTGRRRRRREEAHEGVKDEPQTSKPSRCRDRAESPHRSRLLVSPVRSCLLVLTHAPSTPTHLCGGPASPTDPPVRAHRPGFWLSGSADEGCAGLGGVGGGDSRAWVTRTGGWTRAQCGGERGSGLEESVSVMPAGGSDGGSRRGLCSGLVCLLRVHPSPSCASPSLVVPPRRGTIHPRALRSLLIASDGVSSVTASLCSGSPFGDPEHKLAAPCGGLRSQARSTHALAGVAGALKRPELASLAGRGGGESSVREFFQLLLPNARDRVSMEGATSDDASAETGDPPCEPSS